MISILLELQQPSKLAGFIERVNKKLQIDPRYAKPYPRLARKKPAT